MYEFTARACQNLHSVVYSFRYKHVLMEIIMSLQQIFSVKKNSVEQENISQTFRVRPEVLSVLTCAAA